MRSFKLLLIIILNCYLCLGQQETTNPKYILGGIELSGSHNFDTPSILKIMNLSIGQELSAPGEEVTKGVKALWNQNTFADIQVWKRYKEDKVIILEIYLESLPSLTKFKFIGIKKSEEDALREKINLQIGMPVSTSLLTNSNQKITNYFIEKGYLLTSCKSNVISDTINPNKISAKNLLLTLSNLPIIPKSMGTI